MKKLNSKVIIFICGCILCAAGFITLAVLNRPKHINPEVTEIVSVDNSPVLIEEIDNTEVTLNDVVPDSSVVEEIEMTEEDVPEPYRYNDSKVSEGKHIEIINGVAVEVDDKNTASASETKSYVTLSISCHGILDASTEELKNAIPNEGYLLTSCTVEIKQGDTVKDVLIRVLMNKGIPATYGESPFGTYFSMIDNLSDSKIGHTAGWCYYVNGVMPTVSSSALQVNNGDVISWEYDDDWDLTLF